VYKSEVRKSNQPEDIRDVELYVRRREGDEPTMGVAIMSADKGNMTSIFVKIVNKLWTFQADTGIDPGNEVTIVW